MSIKTELVYPATISLVELIDKNITNFQEGSVLVVSSKIVSLCEGNIIDPATTTKDQLIAENSQYYLNRNLSKYGTMITIVKNSLMLASGIDESNSAGMYVLWPNDPLKTATELYEYLKNKFNLKNLGVLIVDSTSRPMRIGSIGTSLAHFGFKELNDYRGTKDLFGKEITISQANVAECLASAALVTMGEGSEQTPMAVISDVPFVSFSAKDFGSTYNSDTDVFNNDIYEPFWNSVMWHKGGDDPSDR